MHVTQRGCRSMTTAHLRGTIHFCWLEEKESELPNRMTPTTIYLLPVKNNFPCAFDLLNLVDSEVPHEELPTKTQHRLNFIRKRQSDSATASTLIMGI